MLSCSTPSLSPFRLYTLPAWGLPPSIEALNSSLLPSIAEAPELKNRPNRGMKSSQPLTIDGRRAWGLLSNLVGFVIRIRILCILHVSCMYFACILM